MNKIKWMLAISFFGNSLAFASPIHDAAAKGDLQEVKRLLDQGANIEEPETVAIALERTPIILAALRGRVEVLKELLDRGANINYESKVGTALQVLSNNKRQIPEDNYNKIVDIVRNWSIKSGIPVTNIEDKKILDKGKPGSYENDFAYGSREKREEEIGEITKIPMKQGPGKLILEYMDE